MRGTGSGLHGHAKRRRQSANDVLRSDQLALHGRLPLLQGRTMKRAVWSLWLLLALCLIPFSTQAAEKQIGQNCSSDNSAIDWDTIAQCSTNNGGGTYRYGPLILGAMTSPPYSATTCTSSNAGMLQWTGTAFQGCNGTSWTTISGGGVTWPLAGASDSVSAPDYAWSGYTN